MTNNRDSWTNIDDDPNSERVISHNRALLDAAHAAPVDGRAAYLCDLARDRTVLDIGAVEHTVPAHESAEWLHRQLAGVARQCVGLDVLEAPCAALRAEGYDIRVHDIMSEPIAERFELVVAGEVIEHVDAPVRLLAGAAQALAPGARLVVTTPNTFMLNYAWHGLTGRGQRENADHVAQFNPSHMLELGRRSGLHLDRWRGVRAQPVPTAKGRVVARLRSFLSRSILAPEAECDTLIFEFVAAR